MHRERAHARAYTQPAPDGLVADPQRHRRAADVGRPRAGGEQRPCVTPTVGWRRAGAVRRLAGVPGTLVFIPAWNEEASLPAVLADAAEHLPDADVLVIDDGSTDRTAQVAREHGADVVSFASNRGLRAGIAEGYRQALARGYDFCGRLDADGQHLAAELSRMLALVRSGECDVAIGSRFLPESGAGGERYKPAPERVVGTSLLRVVMRLRLGQPISDGTSGLYAVDRKALSLLADDYLCEAPEVEALVRITDAKLRLVEVPVVMRQREHGESSFKGKRAVELVVTIGLTLFAAKLLKQRVDRRNRRSVMRVMRRARRW